MLGCILLLIVIATGATTLLRSNPYKKYDAYRKNDKQVGTMKQIKENKDAYYMSLFYPEFKDKKLNAIVQNYRTKLLTKRKQKGKYIVYVDYDTKKIFNHYTSLIFHEKQINSKGKVMAKESTYYTYDTQQKKQLQLDGLFRSDYMNMIRAQAKKQHMQPDKITKAQLTQFEIVPDGIRFYLKNNKVLHISFLENKRFIRLKNKKIPSLYQTKPLMRSSVSVNPKKPMVALTFDDGPSRANTKDILNTLDKYHAKATFFMLGNKINGMQDIVKDVYQRGFEIGNHSWDHAMTIAASKANPMDKNGVYHEISDTDDAIYQACGQDPTFFRPPYGAINDTLRNTSYHNFALWNVDTQDWKYHDANVVYQAVVNNVHDGAVILMHDIQPTTKDAINKIAAMLQAKGYQMVTLSTLMKYHGDHLIKQGIIKKATYNIVNQ